ncbi:NAD(P)/FAD-dependent oxidoreductase [Xanthobacter agilis]|uniref:D-amino-acid dehydrogenase n=1 Tax=Xanthobacter agilis TaxID=47492 RepID=A0ABU0LCS4_XANAG|nr:FAD-binding oxidoreductase [Xanthobacter agilis]MDQ0504855.1 D-amino-acid dehydrogenase [Xanthobacter agilis]
MARCDVVVLGAGIVGVSVALHLQAHGLSVVLMDHAAPGEGTSFGNAGVIEGSALLPVGFPQDPVTLLSHAMKQTSESNYHLADLPALAPWLWDYFLHSSPQALAATARDLRPLLSRARAEHHALAAPAGVMDLLRPSGWMKLYRTETAFAATAAERALADELKVAYSVLDAAGAIALEPFLKPCFEKAIHWHDCDNCSDPGGLVKAYAALFEARGGVFLHGDALSLRRTGTGWRAETAEGPVDAEEAVVALGPWSVELLEQLGVKAPLVAKRGYHVHLAPENGLTLGRAVVDVAGGYALQSTRYGIRLTTGVEIAARDAPATPVQVERDIPMARELLPLGAVREAEPWLGRRPALPDSKPIIGPAPGIGGLHLALGHGHWGLTLGPVTGLLLAQMMTGNTPFTDPKPFSARRFL